MSADDPKLCTTSGEPPAKVRAEQTEPSGQHKAYLILCDAERKKGFLKPYRDTYEHTTCGTTTRMGRSIAETYARDPYFYGATFCVACNVHRPLSEFRWLPDGEPMDPHDPAWRGPKEGTR
jgi:hypothetical protein